MADADDRGMAASDLERLFTEVATATTEAKELLDKATSFAAGEWGCVPETRYAIPRVRFDMEFGLRIESGVKKLFWLIPLGSRRDELLSHHLQFALNAVAEPPPMPAPGVARRPFQLLEPHFLLSVSAEREICEQLATVLDAAQDGDFQNGLPGQNGPAIEALRKALRVEARKIRKDLKNPPAGRGLVCFRLDGASPRYLVVRVTDKAVNDSLFLYTPGQARSVTVYSVEGDNTDHVSYEPLHFLALTVRNWLMGAPPLRVPCERSEAEQLGLTDLVDFADRFLDGYVAGRQWLATRAAAGDSLRTPTWYDLTEANAEMSYSVLYDDQEEIARFDFTKRLGASGAVPTERYELIRSHATLRAISAETTPQMEITLAAPEFALSGRARGRFLELVASSAQVVAECFAGAKGLGRNEPEFQIERRRYLTFLADPEAQREVVVFLSYKGKTPQEEFLAIWPGRYQGKSRDFAFTCKRDSDGLNSEQIHAVLRLDQDLANITLSTAAGRPDEDSLDKKEYRAFHNFFHAVRIWRGRLGSHLR